MKAKVKAKLKERGKERGNGKKRAPIRVTRADVERAVRSVEKFRRLVKRGKTPAQIFEDLLRLVEIDGEAEDEEREPP
ncbi:MAG: hypothetical protein Kow0069_27570 [Promethearchaeota archaeon]